MKLNSEFVFCRILPTAPFSDPGARQATPGAKSQVGYDAGITLVNVVAKDVLRRR